MPEDTTIQHVTRGEFDAVKELGRERHGTIMIRLDAMEARNMATKEAQDLVNIHLREQVAVLSARVNEGFHSVELWMRVVGLGILLLIAVNAPGILAAIKLVAH